MGSAVAARWRPFVYLASGFGTVPKTDNTEPCSTPCDSYLGTLSIGSGASVDWSAPNLIANRRPKFVEVDLSGLSPPVSPYEDRFLDRGGGELEHDQWERR